MKSKISIALLSLALAAPLALFARADGSSGNGAPAQPMAPTAAQTTASRLVYGLLSDSRYAYRPRALDEALSQDIFRRYIEALDGSKLYFTAADIDAFAPYGKRAGESIRNGELAPAYDIFSVYRKRIGERVGFARELLKQEFDFSGNERWEYDREHAAWAVDAAELDALWTKSVKNDWLRLKLAGQEADAIRSTLDKRYARLERSVEELDGEDVFQFFLNAYTSAIDPHTDYYTPQGTENFNQSISLSLEGIGAVLQRQDEMIAIREVVPGGPAALSGKLQPGDRIVAVGQDSDGAMVDVVGWRVDDVVKLIRGKKGTEVRIEYIPVASGLEGSHATVSLIRQKVKLEEQAAKSEIIEAPANEGAAARRIGVIKLPTFYQDFEGRRRNPDDYNSATRDVARLLAQFKSEGIDGVVLDLRSNGGGSLDEAVELTGLFIDQGPVVQVRESGGRVSVNADRKPGVAWDGPLAVLINRGSASASEIFAGAIQDYGRGLVIGETSFGKGTVQNMIDLDRWPANEEPRFGAVKLTIAQFFRVSGSSTQHKGVVPDLAFPVSVDASEYGESTYDNALPWTQIAAVDHVRYGRFGPLLPTLEHGHAARTATDKEWQWWAEDVAQFRAERDKKYVSLNEAERRAERDRNEAKRKQRQEERKALGLALDPLADVSDDGLGAAERDIVKDAEREKLAEKRPDPLLRESAAILADAIDVLGVDKQLSAKVLPASHASGAWVD